MNNKVSYLDYNATAPLVKPVSDWLADGAVSCFGNSSSTHSVGKKSKSLINQTIQTIKNTFSANDYDVFFHSGATEGINSVFKSFCFSALKEKKPFHVFCFDTDHSCVVNQREHIELLGGYFTVFNTTDGDFNKQEVLKAMSSFDGMKLLNFTQVNNESGVVWNLNDAIAIKEATDCIVHVDSVQLVSKVVSWDKLILGLDYYTFSGHKFGAVKGVGFTLIKKHSPWQALLRGGGQQNALRSGTENTLGAYSIKLALEYNLSNFDAEELKKQKEDFESKLLKDFSDKITLVGAGAKQRNLTTIFISVHEKDINTIMMALDMAGVCASSGSACASGIIKPSRVAKAQGLSDVYATNVLRFSFSPFTKDLEEVYSKVTQVLQRYL